MPRHVAPGESRAERRLEAEVSVPEGTVADQRRAGDTDVEAGTQVARVASFLGKRMEYVNVIDVYEPPRRLVMRSVKAPFPMRVTYDFDAAPGGTLARIRAEGSAGGFYRVAGPLLGTAVRRGIAKDLKTLRGLLEGRGSASSGRAG